MSGGHGHKGHEYTLVAFNKKDNVCNSDGVPLVHQGLSSWGAVLQLPVKESLYIVCHGSERKAGFGVIKLPDSVLAQSSSSMKNLEEKGKKVKESFFNHHRRL